MTQEKITLIRDPYDIITTRMRVREAARHHGLSLTEQACISMAVSSLANNIINKNGAAVEGSITIECLKVDSHLGMRVVCLWKGLTNQTIPYGNERWMVDEVETREVEDHIIEVVLTKWAASSSV